MEILINSTNLTEDQSNFIKFEEIYAVWLGLCYKITPKIITWKFAYNSFQLKFNDSVPDDNIPKVSVCT